MLDPHAFRLDGKTILVLPEQGFGDALCFARFMPVLRRYNPARVALVQQLTYAYLRTALYPEDASWAVASQALRESPQPLGRIACK